MNKAYKIAISLSIIYFIVVGIGVKRIIDCQQKGGEYNDFKCSPKVILKYNDSQNKTNSKLNENSDPEDLQWILKSIPVYLEK